MEIFIQYWKEQPKAKPKTLLYSTERLCERGVWIWHIHSTFIYRNVHFLISLNISVHHKDRLDPPTGSFTKAVAPWHCSSTSAIQLPPASPARGGCKPGTPAGPRAARGYRTGHGARGPSRGVRPTAAKRSRFIPWWGFISYPDGVSFHILMGFHLMFHIFKGVHKTKRGQNSKPEAAQSWDEQHGYEHILIVLKSLWRLLGHIIS